LGDCAIAAVIEQIKHKTKTRLRKIIADTTPYVGRAGNDTGVREQVAILHQLNVSWRPAETRLKSA
jgi:hypothetical protein